MVQWPIIVILSAFVVTVITASVTAAELDFSHWWHFSQSQVRFDSWEAKPLSLLHPSFDLRLPKSAVFPHLLSSSQAKTCQHVDGV